MKEKQIEADRANVVLQFAERNIELIFIYVEPDSIQFYIHNFYSFCYFGIRSDSFYFQHLKIINGRYKKNVKRKANVSVTYGGPLQCHKCLRTCLLLCILTQIPQNFYSFCYFGIGSDSLYFQHFLKALKEKIIKTK